MFNAIFKAAVNAIKFIKDNAKVGAMIVGLGVGAYFLDKNMSKVYADGNPGDLQIKNCLNSKKKNVNLVRDNINFPGAQDSHDNYDISAISKPEGYPNCFIAIQGYNLWDDFRDEDSNVIYDNELSFQGTLSSSMPNWIEFDFPYAVNPFTEEGPYNFGNKPITFESQRLPYGKVVDVKRVIDANDAGIGKIYLIDVPAGTYDQWTPYGSGILEIGTRLPCDFYEDGVVDLKDYAVLAADWQKVQGQYLADISGPNGIPDGYVDNYDLQALSEDWLEDINDPSTW